MTQKNGNILKAIEDATKTLQWIVDNPNAHPANVWRVSKDSLEKVKELSK